MTVDILIKNGRVFDGSGSEPTYVDVGIKNAKISSLTQGIDVPSKKEIDAAGCWVTPGFIDIHTHYDAEILAYPGLESSVKHGVTTAIMGNCSLSTAMGCADDIIDMFGRVENLPPELLRTWIGEQLPWNSPAEYYRYLEAMPLGPNVATFLGHSNLRLEVMGKDACFSRKTPAKSEIKKMQSKLQEALDEGFLGLSIDMLPWHRWKGAKYDGASIPSQFATMTEYRALSDVIRKNGRVLQATPNANRKYTPILLSLLSAGLLQNPMRLTMLAALDFKGNRILNKLTAFLTFFTNRMLRGNLRFQSLACPFEIWSDGFNTPIFEEFSAGAQLMNMDTAAERSALYQNQSWRGQFKKEWLARLNRSFHRDLGEMKIVSCPDDSLVGRTFTDIASEQQEEPVDLFLDLLAEHDDKLRWHSIVANDRPAVLREMMQKPFNQVGFSDAGAHNRNLGFQNAHLCLLRDAKNHSDALSLQQAVHRLTGEVADWFGLDTGCIELGKVADICIMDPDKLDSDLSGPREIDDPRFGDLMRMETDSGEVIRHIVINGSLALTNGVFTEEYGKQKMGRLLRSTHASVS